MRLSGGRPYQLSWMTRRWCSSCPLCAVGVSARPAVRGARSGWRRILMRRSKTSKNTWSEDLTRFSFHFPIRSGEKMQQVTLDEAKERLQDLVDAALRGETVSIALDDEQAVQLV